LKSSIKLTESKNPALEDQLAAAKKKTDEQEEEIAELYQLQDSLEQYTRKQSLEICGIPASAYASTEEALLKIALDVTISAVDINISQKIKSNGAGTSLVKFQSHKAKSRSYKARTSCSRNGTYIHQ